MLRWTLLIFAVATSALGLLTVVKAPEWLDWRVAVFAGEFGYGLAPVSLAVAVGVCLGRDGHRCLSAATFAAAVIGTALLAKPGVQACWIGRKLPAALARQFGSAPPARAPFAVAELFGRWPGPVATETLTYSRDLKLDLYRAAGGESAAARPVPRLAPGVIVVHGGGWDDGERGQIPQFNRWLARRGYVVADISYRLAPKSTWPAQRDDLLAAVAFLQANARSFGLDATRLVLLGRSAGGQLAEATAYAAHLPAIRGVVGLYAPADMNFAYAWGKEDDAIKSPRLLRQFLGGPPASAQAAYDSASAIRFVASSTPPTLLIHGQLDTLVWDRQSERLAQKLTEAGVKNLFVSLPWATHGLEYNLHGPSGQLSTYALEWFLAAVTK